MLLLEPVDQEASSTAFSTTRSKPFEIATERLLERASLGLDGSISREDEQRTRHLTPSSQVRYGEITFEGVRVFVEHCLGSRASAGTDASSSHVFYDLGSGVGRMVLQVFLDFPVVQRSVGVELSRERHEAAVELRRRVLGAEASLHREVHRENGRSCELYCGDILEADFSEVTVIWLANSFMSDEFLRQLCSKMAAAPKLRYVGVNDALSEWDLVLPGFQLDRRMRIPMTWDEEWTAYIYKRTGCH